MFDLVWHLRKPVEGQTQEIFADSLDSTGDENLWQENVCVYNKY